jgi:gas vesicle protein
MQPEQNWARHFLPHGNEVKIMRLGRYESSEGNNVGTAITFFLIGLGAGALAALALAPKTGKQFRRDLRRGYDDAKDTLQDWSEEAKDRVRDAKERVRDVAERGADMAEDLRDRAREKVEPLRRIVNRG